MKILHIIKQWVLGTYREPQAYGSIGFTTVYPESPTTSQNEWSQYIFNTIRIK